MPSGVVHRIRFYPLARAHHSHLRAHLHRYGVVFEDMLRPAKAAALPLQNEIPKGVRGSIDETREAAGRGYWLPSCRYSLAC